MFVGCWLQVWYILASFIPWYTIDKFGRRWSFISMALGMCLVLVLEAIFVAIGGTGPGVAAVVMVFLFEACFTIGWMGAVWVVSSESLDWIEQKLTLHSIRQRSSLSRFEQKAQRWQQQQISSETFWWSK